MREICDPRIEATATSIGGTASPRGVALASIEAYLLFTG